MQVMGIESEIERHVCDPEYENGSCNKLFESIDYLLCETIDNKYEGIIQIKKSYPKEIMIFEKKYKSLKRAKIEYKKKLKKMCSSSSISAYCLKYDEMDFFNEVFNPEVVLLD